MMRLFGPKREEVTAEMLRKLHNEDLRNTYSSPKFIRAIKSRNMKYPTHVERMEEMRNAYRNLVMTPERMSEWMLGAEIMKTLIECIWLRIVSRGMLL